MGLKNPGSYSTISVGTPPVSSTGEIRLPFGGDVVSRNSTNTLDYSLIKSANTSLLGNHVLVDEDAFWVKFGSTVVLSNNEHILSINAAGNALYDMMYLAGNNVLAIGDTDNSGVIIYGTTTLEGTALKIQNLPATDPNVNSRIYTMDAAGIAAELAAGSRYVLVSNGP